MPPDALPLPRPLAPDLLAVAFQAADPFGPDAPAAAPPAQVLVAPFGQVASTNGTFLVDALAMQITIDAFNAHGTDLPIDFEHQSLGGAYSSPSGLAPAAGWIRSLESVLPPAADALAPCTGSGGYFDDSNTSPEGPPAPGPDNPPPPPGNPPAPTSDGADQAPPQGREPGLWAQVDWTPLAVELLTARQYRYLSPVALVRRSDGRMVGLHSVALTNKPAIVGMQPIVAKQPAGVPQAPPTPAPAADTPPVVRIPISDGRTPQSNAPANDSLDRLRIVLALTQDAGDADCVLIAAAQRIIVLQGLLDGRTAADRVERAAAAGKLSLAQRDWAFALALREPAAFDEWLVSAPVLVPLGRIAPPALNDGASLADAVRRRARDEFRRHAAVLSTLCSEEAFVADAVRREGP